MPPHVVILGAGFGGLELATRLSDALGADTRVTLIDRNDAFVFGFAKLEVMVGNRAFADVHTPYRSIKKPGVRFRRETVVSVNPVTRRVVTDASAYDADILVIALGADLDPAATPGFIEGGHEFYSPRGAANVRNVLETFGGGDVVIGVLGGFFKCPPAPNEAALLLHDFFVRRGIRDSVELHLFTPMPMPIPISAETSGAIVDLLAERGIHHHPRTGVERLDPAAKVAHLRDGGTHPYDLFLGIPVHVAPPVVIRAGLTEDDGWIAVDRATFATKFPDVYAVGDVTSTPVPRAGVIAEGEAAVLADVLIERFAGGNPPPAFEGEAICYIETGNGEVARVDVNFLGGDTPSADFHAPSTAYAAEKRDFAATRLERWFGIVGG